MSEGKGFKANASSLFSKTKTEIARAKQKTLVKLGKAEETVDVNYNNEVQRFVENYTLIKKTRKDSTKLLELLKEVSICQANLAEDFYELSESNAELYNATLKYQDIAKSLDNARIQFDEQLKTDFIDPISLYLRQYKEIKARIQEDTTRKVDMDRYSRDIRTANEKAKGGMTIKEQKHETARINYVNLHDELLKDLPKLSEDRLPFFNPAMSTYFTGLSEFYKNSAKSTSDSLQYVNHINRSAIHNHPRITTSNDESYCKVKVNSPRLSAHNNANNANTTHASAPSDFSHNQTHQQPLQTNHQQPLQTNYQQPHQTTQPVPRSTNIPHLPTNKPVPQPGPQLTKAKALYDFAAQESNELPFRTGDVIIIHKKNGDWWEGELNGKKGLLPSNYVQLL